VCHWQPRGVSQECVTGSREECHKSECHKSVISNTNLPFPGPGRAQQEQQKERDSGRNWERRDETSIRVTVSEYPSPSRSLRSYFDAKGDYGTSMGLGRIHKRTGAIPF